LGRLTPAPGLPPSRHPGPNRIVPAKRYNSASGGSRATRALPAVVTSVTLICAQLPQ